LATATDAKIRKLLESCDRRLKEIEAEREPLPEESEVTALFLEIVD
jgi:hypothetical protein